MQITVMKVKYVVMVANHVMLGSSRRPENLFHHVKKKKKHEPGNGGGGLNLHTYSACHSAKQFSESQQREMGTMEDGSKSAGRLL